MKKIVSFFVAFVLVVCAVCGDFSSMTVKAATSGVTGDCTWTLDGTVLTISGNGKMADYADQGPWGTEITEVIIEKGVTSIGAYAFCNCISLSSIIIPESVTSIGFAAFRNCWMSLTSITIPESVTSIGGAAFSACTSLTNITIPESVTSIEMATFSGCSLLTNITIPEGVTSIGGEAFSDCAALTNITVPEGVTSIESATFLGCSRLTSITIPEGVTSIEFYAFYGCSSLTSIRIPESVTSIEFYAFYDCSLLTSVWFTGSQVDRDEMAIDGDNEELLKATWHYNTCADNAHVYLANCDVSCQNCDWIREVDNEHIFAMNAGYTCEGCGYSKKPVAPEIESKTNSSVTLVHIPGCEYSKDGENWQDSNVFTDLSLPSGSSTYTFYQRIKATGQVQVSEKSEGLVVSFPAGGITGDCTWTLDGTVLTISGEGKMEDYASFNQNPWGTEITEVIIEKGVTSIGGHAFKGCSSLTSVTIPEGVTSIGNYAFKGCSSLTSITIPGSVTSIGSSAFEDCSSLTSMTIPEGVTSIRNNTFYRCSSLTSVTISEGVTSIGSSAFVGCSSLTSITIPGSVTSIGASAFKGCSSLTSITIPEGVTSIRSDTFLRCSSLTSVTIPEGVTSIGSSAFEYCSSLTSMTIPEGVTSIGSSAFEYCSSLTSMTIPEGVTSIESYAFQYCKSLTSITIPGSVTSIGYWAFFGCGRLTSVTIPEGVTSIGNGAFLACSSLTSITIPGSVTSIGSDTFLRCSSLTSVTIPEGVTSIGSSAFDGCSSLTSVTIPEGVTSIGNGAFLACSSLTSITIPGSVTSIGSRAFNGCSSLTSVWFTGSQVDRDEMIVESGNDKLLYDATWHYNTCADNAHIYLSNCDVSCQNCDWIREVDNAHVYLADCDVSCQNCDWIREVDNEHIFAMNAGYTCEGCGYSKKPVAPEIESKTNSSVTLVHISGCEYSKDGENWQDSNIFTGLSLPSGSSTYTFYQRIKATGQVQVSEKSEGLVVSFPAGGITGDCTWTLDGTVLTISGNGRMADYYNDPSPWGTEITEVIIKNDVRGIGRSAFAGCSSLTSITIPEGVDSIGISAFKGCSSLTSIQMPEEANFIGSSAFEGCSLLTSVWFTGSQVDRDEMTIDGSNEELLKATWHYNTCADNAHIYISNCDASCQNCDWIREVDNEHIFAMNAGYTCEECGYSKQPVVPQIESKTNSSVTLVHIPGCEYSKDGENWQDSNVFTDLSLLSGSSTYTFYQRIKATEQVQVSEKSEGLVVSFKAAQSTPSAPMVSSCTDTSVTLVEITNGEYSIDGVNWQSSNVFDNLSPNTEYIFYQRYAENDSYEVSNVSVGLTVTTDLPYILGDVNGDEYVTTDDAIQLLYHIMFGDSYLISQPCDFDGNGLLTSNDAIYLQYHINLPDRYPLK